MKIVKRALAVTAILLASFSTSASLINVGGVVWDPDHVFDLFGGAGVIYQNVDLNNGTIDGYGRITTLNGLDSGDLCPGCELTFHFGGYTLDTNDPTSGVDYKGGWMNLWVDETPDSSASDASQLTFANTGDDGGNNALWLSLVGHVIAGTDTTFVGATTGTGALEGDGAFDVTGGLAAWHIDTNSMLLPNQTTTDIIFASDFTKLFYAEGQIEGYGTADFSGDSIPEPSTLAIFGLGLIALALRVHSKRD